MTNVEISPRARIADGVEIGPFTVVGGDVVLEAGVRIGSHCVVGNPHPDAAGPLVVGARTTVRSHAILYAGSRLGAGCHVGHAALLRENCVLGAGVSVGSQADLEGNLTVGRHTRMQGQCHIAPGTTVGEYVWLFPQVTTLNDPLPPSHARAYVTVGDLAVVASRSTLLPGVTVGTGSFVGACSVVRSDVDPAIAVAGDPARTLCRVDQLASPDHGVRHPWAAHFRDVYPQDSWPELDAHLRRISAHVTAARQAARAERKSRLART